MSSPLFALRTIVQSSEARVWFCSIFKIVTKFNNNRPRHREHGDARRVNLRLVARRRIGRDAGLLQLPQQKGAVVGRINHMAARRSRSSWQGPLFRPPQLGERVRPRRPTA